MKITELDSTQFADIYAESEALLNHDMPGGMFINVLRHPALGDVLLLQDGQSGALIQRAAPGESVHDHARAVAAMNFR